MCGDYNVTSCKCSVLYCVHAWADVCAVCVWYRIIVSSAVLQCLVCKYANEKRGCFCTMPNVWIHMEGQPLWLCFLFLQECLQGPAGVSAKTIAANEGRTWGAHMESFCSQFGFSTQSLPSSHICCLHFFNPQQNHNANLKYILKNLKKSMSQRLASEIHS